MAKQCEICGKKTSTGNNVSHANNRIKRTWEANLKKKKIATSQGIQKIRICTKCIKTQKKNK